jgi:hypothetical protein
MHPAYFQLRGVGGAVAGPTAGRGPAADLLGLLKSGGSGGLGAGNDGEDRATETGGERTSVRVCLCSAGSAGRGPVRRPNGRRVAPTGVRVGLDGGIAAAKRRGGLGGVLAEVMLMCCHR